MARLWEADESSAEGPGRRHQGRPIFDARTFLLTAAAGTRISTFKRNEVIFAQGDRADSMKYVQTGFVQLSVVSKAGHRAITGILVPGDFFGEACLNDQLIRTGNAHAVGPSSIVSVERDAMLALLRDDRALSGRLIVDLLVRHHRIEQDLLDQMLSPAEHRLARRLVALTRLSRPATNSRESAAFSQEALADMVGTTRSRINFFLRKFERLGLVSYTPSLTVNSELLNVILRD